MDTTLPILPKKRRTAIYARVSTSMQENGLDAQIRALRTFCEQNKIEDYELFADENQSGTKISRPALDRMMRAVEGGEIDSVVVFAFSRYARSVSHMLRGLEIMKKHSTNFVSLSEKLDLNTSLGHVVFVLTGQSIPASLLSSKNPTKLSYGIKLDPSYYGPTLLEVADDVES